MVAFAWLNYILLTRNSANLPHVLGQNAFIKRRNGVRCNAKALSVLFIALVDHLIIMVPPSFATTFDRIERALEERHGFNNRH